MDIREGTFSVKLYGQAETAIIDYVFDGYIITVFQGRLSKYDIIVKYKKLETGSRLRQPSHTQWAVDFLMKLQGNKELAQEYLQETKLMWENTKPLKNNKYETLKELINNDYKVVLDEKYKELNNYGEYSVEFLCTLMKLLAAQEKTNNPDAYMFGTVIEQLLKDKIDIYKVLSCAGFSGRK